MRAVIGAALQEAALDPLLTGRDHMRLQTMLQGVPTPERVPRAVALLERVGLTQAADRKVRRLLGWDEAAARPRARARARAEHPVPRRADTGLDPQSRTALWEEVARLAREDGVTVFLTTQYLEEADVLADRVGHHRPRSDRRRGHAGRAEGRDRTPERPCGRRPRRGPRRASHPRCSASASRSTAQRHRRAAARRLRADRRRAGLRRGGLEVEDIELRAPTLDDVFLAKTGRTLGGRRRAAWTDAEAA